LVDNLVTLRTLNTTGQRRDSVALGDHPPLNLHGGCTCLKLLVGPDN
jgi:hypothetical protein